MVSIQSLDGIMSTMIKAALVIEHLSILEVGSLRPRFIDRLKHLSDVDIEYLKDLLATPQRRTGFENSVEEREQSSSPQNHYLDGSFQVHSVKWANTTTRLR